MKSTTYSFLLSLFVISPCIGFSQVSQNGFLLSRDLDFDVSELSAPFSDPWAGGMNSCQYSGIDWNLDGVEDLLIFDRIGNTTMPMISNNISGQSSYSFAPEYMHVWPFPELRDWVLAKDFNCDGKADLFASTVGGIKVYRNTSTASTLQFELVTTSPPYIESNYVPTTTNIFVSSADVPAMHDVDNDGDIDILTFSIFGSYVEYHKNMSIEMGYGCDSLIYQVHNRCWGYFSENLNNNSVTMNDSCANNVPGAELTGGSEGDEEGLRHVGSSLLALDLDGDSVTEVILGDISYNNLVALYNDGTVTENHIAVQDTVFPVYDVPVEVSIFPAAFYVDVNNDSKRDLMVSPNASNLSLNFQSSFFYENIGTDAAPIFSFTSTDLIQEDMIDLGSGAYPIAFDHNSDGLMDLVVANFGYYATGGNYPSQLALFENIGSDTVPEFDLIDRDYAGLSTSTLGQALKPTFGDLDGDGDKDMMVGDLQGKIHYFENQPVSGEANFSLNTTFVTDNGGTTIDVGQFATPQLFDVNDDGLLDMLIGERNGNVNYYRNLGSNTVPEWSLQIDSIGQVVVSEYWNVTGYSVPTMFLNSAGDRELLVGSQNGGIFLYDNIEGNVNGTWNKVDSALQNIDDGIRTGAAVYDFTGDGALDLVLGNYRGGLSFWKNNIFTGIREVHSSQDVQVIPNPTTGSFFVNLPQDAFGSRMVVFDLLGNLVFDDEVRNRNDLDVDASNWPAGTYIVSIRSENTAYRARVVLLR